jgi:hypothetical protein
MSIDWNAFTPWSALAGGVLIGIAAALFALLNGRIAGISGVIGGLLRPVEGDIAWRAAFVIGLVGAPLVYLLVAALPRPQIDAPYGALVLAGLFVGLARATARAVPAGTGSAACPGCRLARSSPRPPSWAQASPPCSSRVTCSISEELT